LGGVRICLAGRAQGRLKVWASTGLQMDQKLVNLVTTVRARGWKISWVKIAKVRYMVPFHKSNVFALTVWAATICKPNLIPRQPDVSGFLGVQNLNSNPPKSSDDCRKR
jgi:hypothetical protein